MREQAPLLTIDPARLWRAAPPALDIVSSFSLTPGAVYVDNFNDIWTAPSTAANPPLDTDWVEVASEVRNTSCLTPTSATFAFGSWTYASVAAPYTARFDGFNSAT